LVCKPKTLGGLGILNLRKCVPFVWDGYGMNGVKIQSHGWD
jgi:hypothetical protein